MRRLAFLCLLCSLLLVSYGSGRVAPPVIGPPPDSPRMVKLKQLTFDRRPSAILNASAPQPPDDPKAKKAKPTPLDLEIAALQRNVTLGNWDAVKAYFAKLPAAEGKAGYLQMLRSLQSMPMPGMAGRGMPQGPDGGMDPEMMMMMQQQAMGGPMMQYAEKHRFTPEDLIGLAAASPAPIEKDGLGSLGSILQQCLNGGAVIEAIVARLKTEPARPKGSRSRCVRPRNCSRRPAMPLTLGISCPRWPRHRRTRISKG